MGDALQILQTCCDELFEIELATFPSIIVKARSKLTRTSTVLNSKKVCYPENISVSETTAEQPLQNLLDHTSMRLVNSELVKERILRQAKLIDGDLVTELCLYCKWGFDGATGQSQYKQNFNTSESTDKSLFSTMLVPLDLRSGTFSIWRNPVPSSTRFCRPIKISYEKETNELCQNLRRKQK